MRRFLGSPYPPRGRVPLMPDYSIDLVYNKAQRFPVGHGYGMRQGAPTAVVIHTTNNARATIFAAEIKFLLESPDVSTHFLISKTGQIVQLLDPRACEAWHAGQSVAAWNNDHSIGIELHVSVGEVPTGAQKDACAWLCRKLMAQFGMTPELIETHRAIALPKGRKSDPEGWPDADVYRWRSTLAAPKPRRFKVRGIPIFQATSLSGTLAGHLTSGEVIEVDAVYPNGGGHLKDSRGFIDLDLNALEELP
jgi:hypothetical protein